MLIENNVIDNDSESSDVNGVNKLDSKKERTMSIEMSN